jgi:ABC-type branched-subunit amino acid transport system substrate-binding protein
MAIKARIIANTTAMMARMFQLFCFRTEWLLKVGARLGGRGGLALIPVMLAPWIAASTPLEKPQQGAPVTGQADIVVGQSAPFSGPSSRTAKDFREGALAWFSEVNRRGGIHGRRVRLVSLDDRYDPKLTLANTRQLIDQERAIALFGFFGTANSEAVLPLVEKVGIPLVAPRTGARSLREPIRARVFNLRASYQAEIDVIVDHLVRDGRHNVAVVRIEDAFGEDGLRATQAALGRHGMKPVAVAGVSRNTRNTMETARRIHAAHPSAVLIISTFTTSAALTRDLQRLGSEAQLMNLSPVDVEGLQDLLPGGQANGIGISQVVPFPWDRQVPVVAEYQRLIRQQQRSAHYGFTSLEGFLAARWLTEALERAGANPSHTTLQVAFERMRQVDLGGFQITLAPRDHQASDFVDLTFLGAQRWGP